MSSHIFLRKESQMDNKGWPEMDELGNIKGLELSMFDVITKEDQTNVIVEKQNTQLQIYERRLKRECTT